MRTTHAELERTHSWLHDVLPEGVRDKPLPEQPKTASTQGWQKAGFAATTPVVREEAEEDADDEHAHPSVPEELDLPDLRRNPSFLRRTVSRLRRASFVKKEKKVESGQPGLKSSKAPPNRNGDSSEFHDAMGASGQVVLGHARGAETPSRRRRPSPPLGGGGGSPSNNNKSWRDSLTDWIADVLPDDLRLSERGRAKSKEGARIITTSTQGWIAAGLATTSKRRPQSVAAQSGETLRAELSIGLDGEPPGLSSRRSCSDSLADMLADYDSEREANG